MAAFQAIGHTETTHLAVLKKFGQMVQAGHYPAIVSFYSDGGLRRTYGHLSPSPLPSSLYQNPYDLGVVDAHIQRFLKATRDRDLRELAPKLKIKNRVGRPKRRLVDRDWRRVSDTLRPTTLLSLLYRKRIKAHYRNIDTYLCPDLDPNAVFEALIRVVKALNAVHEALISTAIGPDEYSQLLDAMDTPTYTFVHQRATHVLALGA